MVQLSEECRDVPVVSVSLQDTLNNESQNTARRSTWINQDTSRNRTSQQHSTSNTSSKSTAKSSSKSSSKTTSKSPSSNRTPKRRNSKDTGVLQNTGSPAQVSANQRRSTVDDYDCQNHSTPKKQKLETFGPSTMNTDTNMSEPRSKQLSESSKKCYPKNKNMSTPKNNRSKRKTSKSPSTKLVHNMQSLNPLMNAEPMAELNLLSLPSELINMITNKLKPEDLKHFLLTHPQILEDVKETQFWKRKFEKQLTEAQKTVGGMTEYEKAIQQQRYVVGELYKNQYLKRAIAQVTLHRVIHRHHLEPTERSPKNPGIYGALKMIICKNTLYILSYDKKLHAINLQNIVSAAHPHPRSATRLPQDFSTSTFLESQTAPNVHLNPSSDGLNSRQVYHSNHSAHSSQSSQGTRDPPSNQPQQQSTPPNNANLQNAVQNGSSPETNPANEKPWKVKDRFNAVVDATTDTRREPEKRRYLYVLSQSDELQDLGRVYNDKSSQKNKTIWNPEHVDYVEKDHILQQKTWDVNGFVMAGDRIDVYDEVDNGRRIFNMSFEITMRFTMIRLSKSEENTSGGTVPAPMVPNNYGNNQNQNQNHQNYQNHQNGPQNHRENFPNQNPPTPNQNTPTGNATTQPNLQEQKKRLLTVLSTSGRLFCLDVDEAHLGNLGDAGLQVTLSSLTNQEHGEIVQVNAGVSILTFINKIGHLYVSCQKKGDLQALFGKAEANRRIQENQDAGMAVHNAVRKAIRISVPNVRVSAAVGEDEMTDDGENSGNSNGMDEIRRGMAIFRGNNENDDSEVTIEQNSVSDGDDSDIPTTSTPQQHALNQVTTPETPRTLQQIHSMNSHIQFTPSSDEQNSMDDDAEQNNRRFTENANVGSESGNDEVVGENNGEDGGNTTVNTESSDNNENSDSGNNTDTEEDTTPRIIMSSVGDRHISFVDNHNRLFMMGKNQHGQLGTSDKIDKTTPTQVLQDKFVRFVTCGVNHTIACVEKRDAQDVITGVELYGCGCNQENRLPGPPTFTARDLPNNDQFRKLHVPGLPWNIRQLESVKGMLFSMANYSPEQLFENTFNNYKQRCIQDMQADNLKNMRVEELYIRTQALRCEPLNQPYNMNNQLTLISEMVSRLPRNDHARVGEFLQNAVDSLQDNWLRQSFEEEGRFSGQRRPVRDYPPPRIAMRNRRENGTGNGTGNRVENGNRVESNGNNTNESGSSSNNANNVLEQTSETENDDSMNESQTTMGDED